MFYKIERTADLTLQEISLNFAAKFSVFIDN